MKRVNKLLRHPKYQNYIRKIPSLEADRKFCVHDMEHFLSVARLSYIMSLEEGLNIDKEVIYATALLHDVGRVLEYQDGTPHHEASAKIASELLPECDFGEAEQKEIIVAILNHRKLANKGFAAVFYRADKLSRNCFECQSGDECNWSNEKRNKEITL